VSSFRVDLEAYNGPLDLLLFLIRRDEVDIYDIPIAAITEQYVGYVRVIEALDPNLAGDFLVMAATLMEIKSRTLLPRPPLEEGEEEYIDPRVELVRQLLEYKAFKDAARTLGAAGEWQALKCPRQPVLPQADAGDLDIEEVGIWDLLEAFNKLLEQTGRRATAHEVVYDDTPLALHATDIVDSLQRADGSQRFVQIFAGRTKAELIGMFLALLELIRQRRVRAEQERPFGPIVLHLLDASPIESGTFDLQYAGAPPSPAASPVEPAPSARSEPEDTPDGPDQTSPAPGRNAPDQPDTETEHHDPQ
jgi:segregation and condensation protein A